MNYLGGSLPAPSGSSDDAAEIAAGEVHILIREHVGLDVAEGRLRLVLDAVVEGLDDVFLEMRSTRMCMHHRLALRVAVLGKNCARRWSALDPTRTRAARPFRMLLWGERSEDEIEIG